MEKTKLGIGFSTHMCGTFACQKRIKKSLAFMPSITLSACNWCPFHKWRAPALLRYVHGGCAIRRSHLWTSCATQSIVSITPAQMAFMASPNICHSGCPPDGVWMSQLYASCPRARKAMHTVCDSSQATRTRIFITSFHMRFSRHPCLLPARKAYAIIFPLSMPVCAFSTHRHGGHLGTT